MVRQVEVIKWLSHIVEIYILHDPVEVHRHYEFCSTGHWFDSVF